MRKYFSFLSLFAILSLLTACRGDGAGSHAGDATQEHAEEDHHAHGDSDEAELSEVQMQTVGITLGLPQSRAIGESVEAAGILAVDPQYQAVASPVLPGTVGRILVTEGQHVNKGEVVAYVEVTEGAVLRQELKMAQTELQGARVELERQQALAAQGAGVRKNLDAALQAVSVATVRVQGVEARMRQYGISPEGGSSIPVKADISGTVVSVTAKTGSFADMQTPLLTIVDDSRVYCTLSLFEKDLAAVKPGAAVEMRLTNDPSKTFSGKVVGVNPVLDPSTKTAPVRVSVDASGTRGLMPGMSVSASISSGGREVMALPEEAVVSSGGRSYIFVLEKMEEENGEKMYHFEKREVVTGASSMGYVEITPLEPLDPDSKVVTSGAFYISSMTSDHGEHNH